MSSGCWRLNRPVARCVLWIALCFTLTSAVWLAWLDGLMRDLGASAASWASVVAGYAVQAAGLGAVGLWLKKSLSEDHRRPFGACALLFVATAAPALLVGSAAWRVAFGMAMNLACGALSGFYLYGTALRMRGERRGIAFGAGYALATVAVGLMALVERGWPLRGGHALLLCVPLGAALALVTFKTAMIAPEEGAACGTVAPSTVWLACGVVALLSAVKSMGFSLPAPELDPALSRLPYAIGLVAAGLVNDRSRKDGMACAMAALVLPFILLGLKGENVSAAIGWGIEYLLTGFFAVYRAVLFMDLAVRARRWGLAPLGLLMGRLGDAAGSGLSLLLSGRTTARVALATAAIFVTLIAAFRLYQRLYVPELPRRRSAEELLEAFCQCHDLTGRERDIMLMLVDRRTNPQIAEALFISENTVKYHVRNVLKKTGCANRVELQRQYRRAMSDPAADTLKTEG